MSGLSWRRPRPSIRTSWKADSVHLRHLQKPWDRDRRAACRRDGLRGVERLRRKLLTARAARLPRTCISRIRPGRRPRGRRRRRTDCSLSTTGRLVVRAESRSRLRRPCPLSDCINSWPISARRIWPNRSTNPSEPRELPRRSDESGWVSLGCLPDAPDLPKPTSSFGSTRARGPAISSLVRESSCRGHSLPNLDDRT
jgi:hypothetical protein